MAPKNPQTKRPPQQPPQSDRILRSAAPKHLKPRGCRGRTPLPKSLRWLQVLSARTSDTPSSPSNDLSRKPKPPRPVSVAPLAHYVQGELEYSRMEKIFMDKRQVMRRIQEILDRKRKAGEVIYHF